MTEPKKKKKRKAKKRRHLPRRGTCSRHPGPLSDARRELNLTVREAAAASGVGLMSISRAERGKTILLRDAILLARFYGSTVEKLFGHLTGETYGNVEHEY